MFAAAFDGCVAEDLEEVLGALIDLSGELARNNRLVGKIITVGYILCQMVGCIN